MDSDEKSRLVVGLLFGALGIFVLSHLVYPYRNPIRVGKKGAGSPMSRSIIFLLGCGWLAFGVIAVTSAFSPEIASAALPWAAVVVSIVFISVLISAAFKR